MPWVLLFTLNKVTSKGGVCHNWVLNRNRSEWTSSYIYSSIFCDAFEIIQVYLMLQTCWAKLSLLSVELNNVFLFCMASLYGTLSGLDWKWNIIFIKNYQSNLKYDAECIKTNSLHFHMKVTIKLHQLLFKI